MSGDSQGPNAKGSKRAWKGSLMAVKGQIQRAARGHGIRQWELAVKGRLQRAAGGHGKAMSGGQAYLSGGSSHLL